MPGAPLLIIRPDLIINWWNLTKMCVRDNGTSEMYFTDGEGESSLNTCHLTVEETKAFIVFAKNIGDTLNVKGRQWPQAPQVPQSGDGGNARSRFADLAGGDG